MPVSPLLPSESEPAAQTAWIEAVSALVDQLEEDAVLIGGEYTFTAPQTDFLIYADVEGDGSGTGSWPDRVRFRFTPQGGSPLPTFLLNEFWEVRGMPSASNRVAARWFSADDAAGYAARSAGVPVFEITNYRNPAGERETMFGINHLGEVTVAGDITAPNIGVPILAVLDHDESPSDGPGLYVRLPEPP